MMVAQSTMQMEKREIQITDPKKVKNPHPSVVFFLAFGSVSQHINVGRTVMTYMMRAAQPSGHSKLMSSSASACAANAARKSVQKGDFKYHSSKSLICTKLVSLGSNSDMIPSNS